MPFILWLVPLYFGAAGYLLAQAVWETRCRGAGFDDDDGQDDDDASAPTDPPPDGTVKMAVPPRLGARGIKSLALLFALLALGGCGLFCDHRKDGALVVEGVALIRSELGPTNARVSRAFDNLSALGEALGR